MVIVICCGCCFLQSTIAFVILLPNIYVRRCYISINFALMQFCLSVTATMSFIILSLLKFLPQVSLFVVRLSLWWAHIRSFLTTSSNERKHKNSSTYGYALSIKHVQVFFPQTETISNSIQFKFVATTPAFWINSTAAIQLETNSKRFSFVSW